MAALFNGDKTDIHDWDNLFISYIDLSGMAQSRQKDLMTAIHNIETRLSCIDSFISVQKQCLNIAGVPLQKYVSQRTIIDELGECGPAGGLLSIETKEVSPFDDIKRYGHRLIWNPKDPQGFIMQLDRIESKEKRRVAELNKLHKELSDLSKSKTVKEDKDARQEFIRMLNTLSKEQGYAIDRETTDMETFCLMIKQNQEDSEAMMSKKI